MRQQIADPKQDRIPVDDEQLESFYGDMETSIGEQMESSSVEEDTPYETNEDEDDYPGADQD